MTIIGLTTPSEPALVPSTGETLPSLSARDTAAAGGWMLDPALSGSEASTFSPTAPPSPATPVAGVAALDLSAPAAEPVRTGPIPPAETARPLLVAPLPVPRPPEFRAAPAPRLADAARRARQTASPAVMADNRSFFEKLFGVETTPRPALAYAALETNPVDPTPRRRLSPTPNLGAGTAIYDITARVVTLPNGERLEAHSGLGDKLDDPRHVHVRMRGATPPGTYDLTEREQLFHGVRALRLNPVGGAASIYGRAGLLAHTFMLGPNGDSNGCVSVRDYERFLQAYLRGEISRLVVVSGSGLDALPSVAGRPVGLTKRATPERDT